MAQAQPEARRDRREAARQERRRRLEQRRRRGNYGRWALIAGGVALILGVVIAAVWFIARPGEALGKSVAVEGQRHVDEGTPTTYRSNPPASGDHYPTTAPYAVHEQPVAPGYWIHNLEHGAIVVLYNCPEACPDLVAQFREAFQNFPRSRNFNRVKMVVVPYRDMEHRLAYVAWGKVLETDQYDREQLLRFYNANLDKGPELAP